MDPIVVSPICVSCFDHSNTTVEWIITVFCEQRLPCRCVALDLLQSISIIPGKTECDSIHCVGLADEIPFRVILKSPFACVNQLIGTVGGILAMCATGYPIAVGIIG